MSAVVIVPTYNERANIAELTDRLLQLPVELDILFIDDGSPDGTGALEEELARKHARVSVIQRGRKLGFASALITGYREALKRSYSFVLQMDADLSHDPAAIPAMIDAAKSYDLVLGSRYIGGVRVIDWEMSRIFLSWMANTYARAITRVPVHDVTTGFRCFRRETLEKLDLKRLKANGYGLQIEIAYRVWKSGGRLGEVPIIFYGRRSGKSKMTRAMVFEAGLLVWRLRLTR
ncbi:MAG TPA: polyprenol monophosphomannose synthase [Candidatus Acidoferrales bacterium]|nr:polyprenol monophosphomannose synthase [Candidatus Acidoferrales bacterium]